MAQRVSGFARVPDDASGPSTNHAWFLWDQAQRGPPVLRYVTPEKQNGGVADEQDAY